MNEKTRYRKALAQRLKQISILVVLQALALFVSSGRLDWIEAWVYLIVYLLFILSVGIALRRRGGGTELMEERAQAGEGVKEWDRFLAPLTGFGGILILIIAGIDDRLAWTGRIEPMLQSIGLLMVIGGDYLFGWAMVTNRFFATVVRIQTERGHTVCDQGPYRHVRHPGYLGLILGGVGMPLLFSSLWAFLPFGILLWAAVLRTYYEDRALQAELPGYAEYAQRVRFRLLPGIW